MQKKEFLHFGSNRDVTPALRILRDQTCRTQGVFVAAFPARPHPRAGGDRRAPAAGRDPDPAVYGASGLWPPVRWSVSEAWMGTNHLVRLAFNPVQFDARARTLIVCTNFLGEMLLQDPAADGR